MLFVSWKPESESESETVEDEADVGAVVGRETESANVTVTLELE